MLKVFIIKHIYKELLKINIKRIIKYISEIRSITKYLWKYLSSEKEITSKCEIKQ